MNILVLIHDKHDVFRKSKNQFLILDRIRSKTQIKKTE